MSGLNAVRIVPFKYKTAGLDSERGGMGGVSDGGPERVLQKVAAFHLSVPFTSILHHH